MKIVFKTTSFFLIQLILLTNICWAQQKGLCLNKAPTMLSPAIHIPDQTLQSFFIKLEAVDGTPRIKAFEIDSKFQRDKYLSKIEINFVHDKPGTLHNILLKIGTKAQLNWLFMFKEHGINKIRLGIEADKYAEISKVREGLSEIEDRELMDIKKVAREKYVLKLGLLNRERDFIPIAMFLKNKNINVSKFLPPDLAETGYSYFTLELDVPIKADIKDIEQQLETAVRSLGGDKELIEGTLLRELFDVSLLKGLDIEKTELLRKRLWQALEVIAHHVNMPRKDMKTSYLMHPIGVVRILVNEIKMFTPQTIAYLSKALNITPEELIGDIVTAALLHDAVEEMDITEENLRIKFGDRVADIVLMLSKKEIHKSKSGEAVYLKDIVDRIDIVGVIVQIIKIADRIHNLRTLMDNDPEFQRKIFFYTWDVFIPEFINKIDYNAIKNKQLRNIFKEAVKLCKNQVFDSGLQLGFLITKRKEDKIQRQLFEAEEGIRCNNSAIKGLIKQMEKTLHRNNSMIKNAAERKTRSESPASESLILSSSLLIQQAI